MRDGVVPLRPLTIGEILDAAVALFRRHALPLLLAGALLAVLEQAVLYPLRRQALLSPNYWSLLEPLSGEVRDGGAFWLLVGAGFGIESLIITLLGGLAAPAARAALLGVERARTRAGDQPLSAGERGRLARDLRGRGRLVGGRRQVARLVLLAVVLGLGAAVCAWFGFVPWIAWYALTGLAAPVLVIDQRVPLRPLVVPDQYLAVPLPQAGARPRPIGALRALGRSFALVWRGRRRPGAIRLLGYFAWYAIRIALGIGGTVAVETVLVRGASPTAVWLVTMAVWAIVNAVAYPTLACLDAVVHLENRMRVEGLDLALSRALHSGAPTAPVLAVS